MHRKKEIDTGLKLLAKSSIIVFVGLFLSKVLTYVYRIIIARHFGPEIYGVLSLAIMVIGWFIAIFSLGFVEGMIRFIPQYRGKKDFTRINYLINFSILVLSITSILSAIFLYFSSEFIAINIFNTPQLTIFLKVFSFLIPLTIFSNLFLGILRSFELISWYSFLLNVFQNLIKLVILILLIFLGFKTNSVIFSYFLGTFFLAIAAFLIIKYKIPEILKKVNLKSKEQKSTKKEFVLYSWPIIFIGVVSSLFYWIDSFAIGFFYGATEVGFYNAAIPIAMLLIFVPELFFQLFVPLINREYTSKNSDSIKELSKQVNKWILIMNLPIFLIIFLFPGAIINLLFGEEYLVATTSLMILSIGFFVYSLSSIGGHLVSMKGKSKIILTNLIITSIINLILNFILVPRLGINGAAISTSFVWILLSILLLSEAGFYTKILPFRRKMLGIILVSLVPLFTMVFIKNRLELNILSITLLGSFFVLFYLILILITRCLDRNDRMILKLIKNRFLKN